MKYQTVLFKKGAEDKLNIGLLDGYGSVAWSSEDVFDERDQAWKVLALLASSGNKKALMFFEERNFSYHSIL